MAMKKLLLGVALTVALTTAASASNKGVTLQDKQQAACFKDVQRLCPGLIPDVDKVTDCMKTKRAEVSPECGAMYDAAK